MTNQPTFTCPVCLKPLVFSHKWYHSDPKFYFAECLGHISLAEDGRHLWFGDWVDWTNDPGCLFNHRSVRAGGLYSSFTSISQSALKAHLQDYLDRVNGVIPVVQTVLDTSQEYEWDL